MKIFGDLGSGNCLKVKYTADRLGLSYTWVPIDIMKGETHTPEFLRRFPRERIPAVEFADGRPANSNAIIRYLARGSALLPDDAYLQAKIDEWLFWEQYSHEPYIATTRYHIVYLERSLDQREPWRVERGEKALEFMESQLVSGAPWLVGETVTIADIALLAYTRLAHEGGFDLSGRPGVRAWIGRCEEELGLEPTRRYSPGSPA